MARLYIANTTRQEQVVCYRLDFNNDGSPIEAERSRFQPARQQNIPPGRQIPIGGDFHINQITDIVDQLKRYGLIGEMNVDQVISSGERKVVPYIFQIDRTVSAKSIKTIMDHNAAILIDDGQQRRAKAAVASSDLVQNAVASQFAEIGIDQAPTDKFEVGFEQLEQSEAGEKTIAEGYRMDRKAPAPPVKASKGRRGKRG
jgi:hypothetical protein